METLDLLIAKFKEFKEEIAKSVPGMHDTVEGFMGGLKALPKGSPERGKFITSHMNHGPFVAALGVHPQGAQMKTMLNNHLNSASNAGFKAGSTVAVAKGEDCEKGDFDAKNPGAKVQCPDCKQPTKGAFCTNKGCKGQTFNSGVIAISSGFKKDEELEEELDKALSIAPKTQMMHDASRAAFAAKKPMANPAKAHMPSQAEHAARASMYSDFMPAAKSDVNGSLDGSGVNTVKSEELCMSKNGQWDIKKAEAPKEKMLPRNELISKLKSKYEPGNADMSREEYHKELHNTSHENLHSLWHGVKADHE